MTGQAGDISEALRVHLSEEHPVSHELEDQMRQLETLALSAVPIVPPFTIRTALSVIVVLATPFLYSHST